MEGRKWIAIREVECTTQGSEVLGYDLCMRIGLATQ